MMPNHTSKPRIVPVLFAEQAAEHAAAPAIRYGVQEWSYGQLAADVNRLARVLAMRGVGRGSLVPLLFRPVPDALRAMLAVLQTGAAYVPLDPLYASTRLDKVLDELQAPILLSTGDAAGGRALAFKGEVIDLDRIDLGGVSADPLPVAVTADDLAYMIYTSGTTGTPNGVEVRHASLANYLTWCLQAYPVGANPGGAVVHTSIGFDLTITSLFVPLLAGQPVHFLPLADGNNLEPLARAFVERSRRFSFLKMTPSHLRALRHLLSPADLVRATGCVILGGEPLYAEDLAGWESYLGGDVRVFDEYGPTETTVGSTCYEVTHLPPSGAIPIGAPIAHTSVHVRDEALQPTPAGAVGELCIGGLGVARGYHRREELTARAFVTLPEASSERVYRTGDLVRLRPDGQLEFVGRRDHQVKVRGYRVELEEIEAALREHAAVAGAHVLNVDPAAPRLVAFIVPNVSRRATHSSAGRTIRYGVTASELHAHLAGRLPDYMLPSRFVLLDAFPRTAHDKLDRDALLRLAADGVYAQAEYIAPRSDLEEALTAILGIVLKVEPVGIDDNYFALGGDSIRSIQLAGEAQRRGITLSVGDIHRHPTIRRLAEHLQEARRDFVGMPQTKPFDLISPDDRRLMPDDVEDAYPLNLLQEGMIYHRAFAAKSAVYHAMLSLLLQAPFDFDALRHVVQALVNRHPLMRTSFDQRRFSMPLQLVHRTFKDPLQFVDLRGLPPDEQRARVEAWIQAEKIRGFDIDAFPLIRFMVHQLGEDTFQLTFSYHHEIIDGWSESTMVSELLTHYLSIVAGEPVEMRAPNASFRDSVLLEQMALQSDECKSFWERTLEGSSLMRLPRLLTGPKADKGQREIVKLHFPFSREESDGLKRLALTLGVPLKSVLLAGHMKVMGLFGGSGDVLTHTVSNGRPETPDGAGLVGLFVNSFTFRQKLGHMSWRDLVLETLRLEQASIPYRRYPMAELKRHQGRDPLSETLFFLIDYHVYHRLERWTNAKLLRYDVYGESTFPFCATFRVDHFTSELDMQIEYDSLQFPRELIDAIAHAYARAYQSMVASPSAGHHLFSLQAPDTALEPPAVSLAPASCIHEWIEQQAGRVPDAIAVVCGSETVSYAGLNARASQLARWLTTRGVGPEGRVALFLERSIDLVIGMLAVLKAGACYVPLDPEHRSERISAILEEAAPSLILTQETLLGTLGDVRQRHTCDVCVLDTVWDEAPTMASSDVALAADPENLAYVIFTSGSTGRPKGVMVSHAALVNSTAARLRIYDAPPERFLLLSSPAFDSSVAGLYWTLCTGSTLVLPPAQGTVDLNQALNLTRREQATHTLCIPSFYGSLLESARAGDLDTLGVMIVAGEECRSDLCEQHTRKAPSVAFFNEYGPSEATVWSTVWQGDPSVVRASLPIGRPVANTTAFVLDRDRHVAPAGVIGELCVGGANLARGYLDDPKSTAERFVPNPFAADAGARLYRTGDLSRVTLADDFEYVGRLDHQIKVRGFRIEPAEVEAALETHPKVKRAVVVASEREAGEKVLVAYVVAAPHETVTPAELLAFAGDKLPKYLIPASFVIVGALPLTATGKVDRQALPDVAFATTDAIGPVAPRTPTEEAIAGMWSRVLGIERVGVLDDFFALGGESLRAMRVLSQIRKAFDVELPIASLIQTSATVAALAEEVDAALWLRAGPAAETPSEGVGDLVV